MEEYLMMRDNSTSRANFPFGSPNSSAGFARNTSNANPNTQSLPNNGFNHQSNGWFLSEIPVNVKIEGSNSQSLSDIKYASERGSRATTQLHEHANFCNDDALKAKILNHPQYTNLLGAYIDCQKVGAPAEVVARLTAVAQEFEKPSAPNCMNISTDPELDQFMEAYCNMLMKYRDELTKPLQEAMDFIRKVETQLSCLNNGSVRVTSSEVKCEGGVSSEEDIDGSGGESELPEIDPRAEDRELKNHLLKKYSGYLSNLKQEFSKKRKKGKLPKEARQKLLNWWEIHYKWPYPSEAEKMALAESTGLDQKQINNWFINQRKRHWKPPEDMQFVVMDGYHPHNTAMYMDGHFIGEGPYRFGP